MSNLTAPLKLTLYGIDNEIKRELTRSIIPFGILERALDLQEEFGNSGVNESTALDKSKVDLLTDFIVYIFDDQVSAEEIKRGASITDIFALYGQIFKMVSTVMPRNPTTALANQQADLTKVRQGRKK